MPRGLAEKTINCLITGILLAIIGSKHCISQMGWLMPEVRVQGKIIICQERENLRQLCLKNGIEIHSGQSRWINCRGIGTCGTCALKIEGEVSEANWKDRARRALPPHSLDKDRRLACQTEVLGDIKIQKYDGFWGQGETIIW